MTEQEIFEARTKLHEAGFMADDWPDEAVMVFAILKDERNRYLQMLDNYHQAYCEGRDIPDEQRHTTRPAEDSFQELASLTGKAMQNEQLKQVIHKVREYRNLCAPNLDYRMQWNPTVATFATRNAGDEAEIP